MNQAPLEFVDVVPVFNGLNVSAADSANASGTALGVAAGTVNWYSMENAQVLAAKIELISRDTGYVSGIIVEQAQDNIGTGAKTLETFTLTSGQFNKTTGALTGGAANSASGAFNNQSQGIITDQTVPPTQTGVIAVTIEASRLDVANAFQFVRVRFQVSGGTTNLFKMTYVAAMFRFSHLLRSQYGLRLPQDQQNDQLT